MQELKRLDKVAYVRFASVYRDFRDIGEFMAELRTCEREGMMTPCGLLAIVLAALASWTAGSPRRIHVSTVARDGRVFVSFTLTDGLTADMERGASSRARRPRSPTRSTCAGRCSSGSTARIASADGHGHRAVRHPDPALPVSPQRRRPARGLAGDRRQRPRCERFMTAFESAAAVQHGRLEPNVEYYVRVRRPDAAAGDLVLLAVGPRRCDRVRAVHVHPVDAPRSRRMPEYGPGSPSVARPPVVRRPARRRRAPPRRRGGRSATTPSCCSSASCCLVGRPRGHDDAGQPVQPASRPTS